MIYVVNKDTFIGEYTSNLIFDVDINTPLENPFKIGGKYNIKNKIVPNEKISNLAYISYFNAMYSKDKEFTKYFDEIYNAVKTGKDVYLQTHYAPLYCHADIIEKKIEEKLLQEKIIINNIQL